MARKPVARKPVRPEMDETMPEEDDAPKGVKAADGPTTGYRDGPKGIIETTTFLDGFIPEGWIDTPAKCGNYSGDGHDEYVKV